jgi:hypothetical protein
VIETRRRDVQLVDGLEGRHRRLTGGVTIEPGGYAVNMLARSAVAEEGVARDTRRRIEATGQRPGLDVSLLVDPAAAPDGAEHFILVRLGGGTPPLRVYLYVNGALAESWMPAPATCEVALGGLGPGRHAVTARAIDASGRWGGASAVVHTA